MLKGPQPDLAQWSCYLLARPSDSKKSYSIKYRIPITHYETSISDDFFFSIYCKYIGLDTGEFVADLIRLSGGVILALLLL